MSKEEFIKRIKKDSEINLIKSYRDDETVLEEIYNLCRKTLETQLSATLFNNEEGERSYIIQDVEFENLRHHIDKFIETYEADISDVLDALKKYYRSTQKDGESRTDADLPSSQNGEGSTGKLYDFNIIDWDYFKIGLKIK